MGGVGRERDQPRSDPRRRFRGESRGACITRCPADHEHVTEITFVGGACSRLEMLRGPRTVE